MKTLRFITICVALCAWMVTGCSADPYAGDQDVGVNGEEDADGDGDADDPDADGDGDIIPEDGTAARGGLTPGASLSTGSNFTLSGELSVVPPKTVIKGDTYEMRVGPSLSF